VSFVEPFSLIFVSVGIFAGAVVSSLVGFAFSAVAGAVLLHVLPPTDAVPLMMACSTVTQLFSLVALRNSMEWKGNLLLIAGGALGILPSLYLLHHVDARIFRIGFGLFLAAYAGYMLVRPAAALVQAGPGRLRDAAIGFGGGFIGGLTAMPGALPTIWCDLCGMPKNQQRGLVQPFIAAMQLLALAVMFWRGGLSHEAMIDLVVSLPALACGVALGIVMFRKIDDVLFRRVVLAVLIIAGLALAL
jgi:uncharacterized membrane protein YfcA